MNNRIYTSGEQLSLLQLALRSIESGLRTATPESVNSEEYPQSLSEQRACFVTLKNDGALRGCIGTLEARRRLVEDVAANAFAAAFADPRFQKLGRDEMDYINIGISVLGAKEMLTFDSQQSLIDMLRPGLDGLILQDRNIRATFLPTVWESIPQPAEFLNQLKLKAGLTADHWSNTLAVWRYTSESFSAPVSDIRKSKESAIIAE